MTDNPSVHPAIPLDEKRCGNCGEVLSAPSYVWVDDTVWPVNVGEIEWALRYAPKNAMTRSDLLIAASIVHAYAFLTDPHRTHGDAVASLRRARKAAGRD